MALETDFPDAEINLLLLIINCYHLREFLLKLQNVCRFYKGRCAESCFLALNLKLTTRLVALYFHLSARYAPQQPS